MSEYIVTILVTRIKAGWINPKTNLPLTVNDILIADYKQAVEDRLNAQ